MYFGMYVMYFSTYKQGLQQVQLDIGKMYAQNWLEKRK